MMGRYKYDWEIHTDKMGDTDMMGDVGMMETDIIEHTDMMVDTDEMGRNINDGEIQTFCCMEEGLSIQN